MFTTSMFENEFTWGNAVANKSTDVFHEQYEKAVEVVLKELNKEYPLIINGKEIFSKNLFDLKKVSEYAEAMEKKYAEIRELTCPDDD